MKIKNVEDIYPLSPMQELMLVHTLANPQAHMLSQHLHYILHGQVDLLRLRAAWEHTVARHAVLRTAIIWEHMKKPLQIVRRQVELPWREEDWRGLATQMQDKQLEALQAENQVRGIDISKAPLMRITVIRTDEQIVHLIWNFHHILLDGWSRNLIFQEMLQIYSELQQGKVQVWEPVPPYRDYIAWLKQQDMEAARYFWQEMLSGFTQPTILQESDDTNQRIESAEGHLSEELILLDLQTTDKLVALVRENQLTMNTLLQGMWALLLSKYSGQKDIVIGITVSGRSADLAGISTMTGLFINNLPLRIQLSNSQQCVMAWLKDIQSWQNRMRLYEYTPLSAIQAWSGIDLGQRLFETMVIFENYPKAELENDPHLSVQEISGGARTGYPLTLIAEGGPMLIMEVSYETGRFSRDFILTLLEQLQHLLEQFCKQPQQSVSALQHLSGIQCNKRVQLKEQPIAQMPQENSTEQIRNRSGTRFVAPRDETEQRMTALWEEILNQRPLSVKDNFFRLGGHSFIALQLMERIRQEFGRELALSTLFQGATIEKLAAAIHHEGNQESPSPLVVLQGQGQKIPFFCIHPSGGNVLCYYDLATHLGTEQPFYALEDLSLYEKEIRQISIEEMASAYIKVIRQVQPAGPYLLGGWSFGGLVAFEMAQQLIQQSSSTALLALIDSRPPQVSIRLTDGNEVTILGRFAYDEGQRNGLELDIPLANLRQQPRDEALQYILTQMKLAGIVGPEIGLSWVHNFVKRAKAKIWAVANYQAQIYKGHITLFRTQKGIQQDLQRLELAVDKQYYDETYGWSSLSSQPVTVKTIAATHLSIVIEPAVRELARQLQTSIEAIQTARIQR
ncbi:non-ribosomal peptide synthetase [Ktedonosporobacter rubrisoli]|uniref:Non-ribosomal peptide synthetase n=1 Tax=Ktedonosporobacter rubrisoli TaxID=2509675 RepID=A0A4P6JPR4_KTERU|nr:condensation domain-containing protein [Ktedonosporobacter rubrisoli]QBD77254.1 non-ribosomal peptide synthetase [Ktedonosporobacter rubrisoli]